MSVTVVLLGHEVQLHLGVLHAVWNVLLPAGSVLPVDVCGTFALGSTQALKIFYKHDTMF